MTTSHSKQEVICRRSSSKTLTNKLPGPRMESIVERMVERMKTSTKKLPGPRVKSIVERMLFTALLRLPRPRGYTYNNSLSSFPVHTQASTRPYDLQRIHATFDASTSKLISMLRT